MKPVLYYLARDLIPLRPVEFKDPATHPPQKRILFYWNHSPFLRRHLRILTGIDIIILELEFGLKLFYILRFELDTVVILSSSSLSAIGVVVFLFTLWYILWIRKRLRKEEPRMLHAAEAIRWWPLPSL